LICAGIGLAIPKNHVHGYIAEHHGYGMSEKRTEDLVETSRPRCSRRRWHSLRRRKSLDEREQQYKMSGEIVKTRGYVQTAEGG